MSTIFADWKEAVPLSCDGYILPSHDAFRSEMPPQAYKRLEAATGFSGSAGCAVFTREHGGRLLTDGRYLLQASQEIDTDYFRVEDSRVFSLGTICSQIYPEEAVIGYDPTLWSEHEIATCRKEATGCTFKAIDENPIDVARAKKTHKMSWDPATPEMQDVKISGADISEKLARISAVLTEQGVDYLFESVSESACWALNMRGFDMPFTPALFSRILIRKDGGAVWFLHEASRLAQSIKQVLQSAGVEILEEYTCISYLKTLPSEQTIQYDEKVTPIGIAECCGHMRVARRTSPIAMMQAVKYPAECRAIEEGHREDGLAVTRFLLAFSDIIHQNKSLSECEIVDMLRGYRREANGYYRDSFDTIAGIDGNGAVIHYRPIAGKDARMSPSSRTLLIDSGGQYPGATTDITRTIALAGVQDEEKQRYTRVLQGHIALASTVFPKGISGGDLDSIARKPLWRDGLDYAHGTGHGIGCFMGVHEGPHRISRRAHVALEPGMVLSNEPGFYKEHAYGIRIENVMYVYEIPSVSDGCFYGFHTVTLAPLDPRMLVPHLLSQEEKTWLRTYHQRVADAYISLLNEHEARALQDILEFYRTI